MKKSGGRLLEVEQQLPDWPIEEHDPPIPRQIKNSAGKVQAGAAAACLLIKVALATKKIRNLQTRRGNWVNTGLQRDTEPCRRLKRDPCETERYLAKHFKTALRVPIFVCRKHSVLHQREMNKSVHCPQLPRVTQSNASDMSRSKY